MIRGAIWLTTSIQTRNIIMKKNVIREKSYNFALSVILLCKDLNKNHEYLFSKQLFRSGTSIGANIRESQSAESTKDFIHKLTISLKESREVDYWLHLLKDSNTYSKERIDQLILENIEISKILARIIITMKKK